MKCRVHLQLLFVGLGLLLITGCSFSRGSQVSRASETGQKIADDLADEAVVKTASAEVPAGGEDGPPSQPGVRSPGGSRKKLSGWLSKGKNKTNSSTIPLDRTDKSQSEESDAEEDSGWWKHQDAAPATAQNGTKGKNKEPDSLSLSSTNPFDN